MFFKKASAYSHDILRHYTHEKAIRFYLYSIFNRKTFEEWFRYIEEEIPADIDRKLKLHLAQRICRPYMRPWFGLKEKISLLSSHYRTLLGSFQPQFLIGILQDGIILGKTTGKSGREYAVKLIRETSKEGEIKFLFIDLELDATLATLSGTLHQQEGEMTLIIGGIQGANAKLDRRVISFATHDLNNLRPKQAVFHAACAFVEYFKIKKIIAPNLQNHVSIHGWRRFVPKRKIHADYNGFWEEFAPDILSDRDYALSLPLRRRDVSEVQSKRRKDWIARYNRIDELSRNIVSAITDYAGHRPDPV